MIDEKSGEERPRYVGEGLNIPGGGYGSLKISNNSADEKINTWIGERGNKYFCDSCIKRNDILKVIKVKLHPHFLYMFKNTSDNIDLLGDGNVGFGSKLLGSYHTFSQDGLIYKGERGKFAIGEECFTKVNEAHNKERELKKQQSITVNMLSLKEKDLI